MKKLIYILPILMLALSACNHSNVFFADFSSGVEGSPPLSSPPGEPSDDRLELIAGEVVVALDPQNAQNKVLKLPISSRVELFPGGMPHGTSKYVFATKFYLKNSATQTFSDNFTGVVFIILEEDRSPKELMSISNEKLTIWGESHDLVIDLEDGEWYNLLLVLDGDSGDFSILITGKNEVKIFSTLYQKTNPFEEINRILILSATPKNPETGIEVLFDDIVLENRNAVEMVQ